VQEPPQANRLSPAKLSRCEPSLAAANIWAGKGEPHGNGLLPIGTFDRVAAGISPDDEPDRLHANWAILLLPYLEQAALRDAFDLEVPVDDPANLDARTTNLSVMQCPDDANNGAFYERALMAGAQGHSYARGNYAMNLGPNLPCLPTHILCPPGAGFQSDTNDLENTQTKLWGSGVGGFNVAFSLKRFAEKGLSNMIAIDEIRAGIAPIDPRGTWALGMVGASLTAAHALGPNQQGESLLGIISLDGINSCELLKFNGTAPGSRGMPCSDAPTPANYAATARSQHAGLVNVAKLDGSVESINDSIDKKTWTSLHSVDETLADLLFPE